MGYSAGNSAGNTSKVRIIAGRWRGRKISFPVNLLIRPTPDRVRETVFNWLAPYIANSCCLDLYAGSGILGFEALSRGATDMVFVDSEKAIIKNLELQHQNLKIDFEIEKKIINTVKYQYCDALAYLDARTIKFDLVFLDPPYLKNMIPEVIKRLAEKKLMVKDGVIYLEMAKSELLPNLPENWTVIKNKVMSQVACYLIRVMN